MADDTFVARVDGIDDLKRRVADLPEKIKRRAVRGALKEAAKPILQAAQAGAPVLERPTPYRNKGTVKRALKIRTSKFAKREGDEGVFINPKPLVRQAAPGKKQRKKAGRQGYASAKNPNDPFYWYFLEFGTKKMEKKEFMAPAAESRGDEATQTFFRSAIPNIEKLNRTK